MDYNVFELIPECVDDRDKLKNILYFLFSTEKIKANTILAAQDAGIVNKLLAVKAINQNKELIYISNCCRFVFDIINSINIRGIAL